jgi:DNA-binding Lrp family transcriptional regulator
MKKADKQRLDAALDKALAPPRRRPQASLDALLDEYTPEEVKADALQSAPPSRVAPPSDAAPPQNEQPLLQNVAATPDVAPPPHVEASKFISIPNDIFDSILPTLKPVEQLVLLRLYRLSRGFQRARCTVSIGTLAKRCSIGTTAARNATFELERRGFIKRIGSDLSNPNQQARGVEFEVLLAAAAPPRSVAPSSRGAATLDAAPTRGVANKLNTQKEKHTTQEGVSVGSKFSLEECQRYAAHLKSTGQGITNPGGYATKIYRSGEADSLIEKFINPVPRTDVSKCPDCEGKGYYFPDPSKPETVRCKHARLRA